MGADQGPVVQSALLRAELVRLRKKSKLTQDQVARRLEWSPSKLIRVEGGHSSITKVDLDALLDQYGIPASSDAERDRLQRLNRGARSAGWWDAYSKEIGAPYLKYVGYEAGAAVIRQFPGTVVPGLLQTRAYAKELTTSAAEAVEVGQVVRLRMQRQEELAKRDDPPRQEYVLDEASIRRHIGVDSDPGIMPAQLRHIADIAKRDLVSVRLIPFTKGAYGLSGAFTLLEFEGDLPDLVYLDPGQAELAIIATESDRVASYASKFETLLGLALPQDESIEFILTAAEEMLLRGSRHVGTHRLLCSPISPIPVMSFRNNFSVAN